MPGTDIFLSYARQDRSTARMFAECLVEEGFEVWWDASLRSGETFDEVIERNLRDAKAVVVLWSPASVASRWVRAEATLADRRNKLAPAIIEACDRPIIFELTHAAELSDWAGDMSDARWRTFVSDLRRLMEAASDQQQIAAERSPAKPQAAAKAIGEVASVAPVSGRQSLGRGDDEAVSADRIPRNGPVFQSPPKPAPVTEPPAATELPAATEIHCLEVEAEELPEQTIVVGSTGVKIGRTAPADTVLPHASISREHCMIGLANDELLVTDLNSTNGTYIDEVRISRSAILPVGSVLRVGQVSLRHAIHVHPEAERRRGAPGNRDEALPAGHLAAAP